MVLEADDEVIGLTVFEVRQTGRSIRPDGQISKSLSSPFCKNILIFRRRKSLYIHAVLSHRGGGSRSSRTRDRLRWTQAAPKTRALFLRTAKSCGPVGQHFFRSPKIEENP